MAVTVNLTVNGTRRTVTTEPQRRLLDVLREDLQLTGTKKAFSVQMMDGLYYGQTRVLELHQDDPGHLKVPVVLPAGRLALRVIAGFPIGAAASDRVRLSLKLTDKHGAEHHVLLESHPIARGRGQAPLFLALLEIPRSEKTRIEFLTLQWTGSGDLHLVDLTVDRQ